MTVEPRLEIDLPAPLVTINLSGNGTKAIDLEVDQEVRISCHGIVRKTGLAHNAEGAPLPFCNVQIDAINNITKAD